MLEDASIKLSAVAASLTTVSARAMLTTMGRPLRRDGRSSAQALRRRRYPKENVLWFTKGP
jgi:hypothetical protein